MISARSVPGRAWPSLAQAGDDAVARTRRRRVRLRQELAIRSSTALIVIVFQVVVHLGRGEKADGVILAAALLALLLNGPYYLAVQSGRWLRAQAYARMLVDVLLITVGLYSAGGLGAAQYLGIYLLVPIYTGIVFSSAACLVATGMATFSYTAIVVLQQAGTLSLPPSRLPDPAVVATFNLIVLNLAGALTALLAQALRESRRRLRTTYQDLERFIEAVPDVIYVLDRDGRLTLWNHRLEAATGLSARTLKGRPLVELLAEGGQEAMRAALDRGMAHGRFEVESPLRGADGAPVAYHWTGAALADEEGRVSGLSGVGRDVTERKRAEEALRQREDEMRQIQRIEAVGRLAGGVAHDFNNLLTVIIGRCQLVLNGRTPADPMFQNLEQIEGAAKRAANLARQLLAVGRKQPLAPRVVNLNTVVTSVMGMLQRLLGEDIELVSRLDPELGRIKADPGQLEQVILNLAVNARDAMPDGGRLTVETHNTHLDAAFTDAHPGASQGPHVVLRVRDTGVGMDEQTRARVFEPFFTTKGPDKGTGLGLSTAYGIVKQHGGHIAVESAPRLGTTFTIYLPQIDPTCADLPPEEAPEHHTMRTAPTGRATILLAEDEAEVRGMVQEILGRLGYDVLAAADGTAALTLSESHRGPIELLLTDIVMPGMSGLELADRVLTSRPDTKVLYVTGYAEHRVTGADLLQKPFTADVLARRVAGAIRGESPRPLDESPGTSELASVPSLD